MPIVVITNNTKSSRLDEKHIARRLTVVLKTTEACTVKLTEYMNRDVKHVP